MDILKLSRVWTLTTTKVGYYRRNCDGGVSFAASLRSSMHSTTRCSFECGCLDEKGKNDQNEAVLVAGRSRRRFCIVQAPFRHNVDQRRRESMSRSSTYESGATTSLAVVSDDDVEIHRKELFARYLDEGLESARNGTECDHDEEEAEENVGRGRNEVFVTRRASAKASPNSVAGLEEKCRSEKRFRWKGLDTRRMLAPRPQGILLLIILTFLYGSNISIIKSAGTIMDPTLFSVCRFAIASLAFTPFLSHAFRTESLRSASVELGLLASAGYLTQCISVLTTDASRVSFISTFTVIVVPLLAGLSGAKISKITWIAAASALVGVGLLESNGTPFAIGDAWSFVSAVTFGVHMLRTEHHSKALAHEDSLPVTALQLAVITFCSGVWFCASHFRSGDMMADLPTGNWFSVCTKVVSLPWLLFLYTGLLSTAFCLWAELVSMRYVKATEAAVMYTLEPLWGAAFAWLTLGERWGPNGWLGAFFILGGSLTMQLFGHLDTSNLNKMVLPPSSRDLFDTVESSVDGERPKKSTKVSDVNIKASRKGRQMARKPTLASRRDA